MRGPRKIEDFVGCGKKKMRSLGTVQVPTEASQQVSTTESYFCLHQRKGTQFPVEDI